MPSPLDQGRTLTESRVIEIVRQIIRTEIRKLVLSAGAIDHGALAGLLDDDHPQYLPDLAATGGDGITVAGRTIHVDVAVNGALGFVGGELFVGVDNISIIVNGSNQLEVDVGPGLVLSGSGITFAAGLGLALDGSDDTAAIRFTNLTEEINIDVANDYIAFHDNSAAAIETRRVNIDDFFAAANAAGIGLSHPQVLARTLGA